MRKCRICQQMKGVVTETVIAGKRGYLCYDPKCRAEHNAICPNCGHHWNAHSDYIGQEHRICEEVLPEPYLGYRLRIHYTEYNTLWFTQAWEGKVFAVEHHGLRSIGLCKQSIARRLKADRGELPLPAAVHTPKSFFDDKEDW